MDAPELSAVVPAYNEAVGIAETLHTLGAALDGLGLAHEIIVVDNASADGTAAAVEALADPRVRVLRNPANLGKGASVRRGMLDSRAPLRLHCDADCGPSLGSLGDLLAAVRSGADVAVGSRLAAGADVGRRQPLRRRIAGRAYVDLCRLVLREPTHDLFCGFKLWRAPAAESVFRRTRIDGWAFDAEALALARALDLRITEVGIAWQDRAGSRLSMPRTVLPALAELARARGHVRRAVRSGVQVVEADAAA